MTKIKDILSSIAYWLSFAVWYSLSLLPFWFHYLFSDLVFLLLFYVIRYRRKVVHQNLTASYPDKTAKEILKIERQFYQHFCDIFIESLKYISMSRKTIMHRMEFRGIDLIDESCRNGRSCGIFLGHYANWEWISSLPLWVNPEYTLCTQLYHPLENKVFDRLISYTRQRLGGRNIPVNESVRHFVTYRKAGRPIVIGFIADQVPFWNNIHYWAKFLNHPETPVFTGAERLMKKFDMDVYYLDVQRVKRGHYVAEFKLLTTTPTAVPDYDLTEQYTRMLESTINRAPAYWLWSHKRWKRTKQEWEQIIDPVTGKMS